MIWNIIITLVLLIIIYLVYVTADTYFLRQKQLNTNPNFSEPIGSKFPFIIENFLEYGFKEVLRKKDEIKLSHIESQTGIRHEITMMYQIDNQIQFIYQAYKEKKHLKTSQHMCNASSSEATINIECISFFESVIYEANEPLN